MPRKSLWNDIAGSTIVEFAIIAPTLMLMTGGAVEMGHLAMARASLEGATMTAARRAMTGACPESRKGDMRDYIERRMEAYASTEDKPFITIKNYGDRVANVGSPEPFEDENENGVWEDPEPYDDLNGDGKWSSDMGKLGDLGGPGDVVSYTAEFHATAIMPFTGWVTDDHFVLSATTVVRNEPIFSGKCANIEAEEEEKDDT